MINKMLPATRTFALRRTSKTMRAAVENGKVDTVEVARRGVKFPRGDALLDKMNGMNAWCKVILLCPKECELGEGGGRAIADALRVNSTVTLLDLGNNELGEGGAQTIAEALRVNSTVSSLNLRSNGVGVRAEDGQSQRRCA